MSRDFVHLHNHTEFSLLDGASRVTELAGLIADQSAPAVAMTDHGNLFGAVSFFEAVKKAGPQPIIGCEVYVAPGSRFDKKVVDQRETAYHLVLLAENDTGYRNLCKLVTAGYMEGFYYKPRIDLDLLQEHSEGLVCLSGCLAGEVAQAIMRGEYDEARRKARMFQELFGDRYFLEIQANGLDEQIKVNEQKILLARELGIGLVATNDNHYLRKEDAYPHDCLLCIGTRKNIEDTDRLKFPNNQFYVKDPDEMWETFKDIPEALDNTVRIAERCRFEFSFGEFHLPQFADPGQDLDALLEESAKKGMTDRLAGLESRGRPLSDDERQAYTERLDFELGVIRDMGFAGYFLIVSDFIRWAKENRIPVGPGRGSAAGSLVSYSTEITDLDPLEFGLLFERFLNPERKSMPDIDVDICMNRRADVIEYVSERYGGEEHVAQIGAFGTAKGRQIFKDVGRIFGLTFAETDRITKLMPAPPEEFRLSDLYENDKELRDALAQDQRLEDAYRIAQRLEGITRHATVHAAGVVVSDKPLVEYLPLHRGDHGETVTQYDMDGVEKIGLVKFDFLGLKTLTAMQTAVDLASEYEGVDIDLDAIPNDDEKTFELLREGRTAGVFQLESEGMRRLLMQLQPENLDEVIAVTALYRPGPMQSGMVDEFVARKHGRTKVTYMLPHLESILDETYGVIVYQEQVMEIAKQLALYSLGEADILRKAMGKKVPEIMQQQRDRFVSGCIENQIDEKIAGELFDLIVEFAGYGFNKSHSACYGLIAYRTAWLKAHHPVSFMAALMQCDRDKAQKLIPILREARSMGIEILPPDINNSGATFTPDGDKIRFGLAAIKNVGEKPVTEILNVREDGGPFNDLGDFFARLDGGTVNKKIMEGFIRSGALDVFGYNRASLMEGLESMLAWASRHHEEIDSGQQNLFGGSDDETGINELEVPDAEEWGPHDIAEGERETIGFYLSAHPLDPYLGTLPRFANTTLADEQLERFGDRSSVKFGGVITGQRLQNTAKGRRAYLQVEDKEGMVEVGLFGDNYNEYRDFISVGSPVFIEGDLMVDSEKMRRMFAKKIVPLHQLEQRLGKSFHICVNLEAVNRDTSGQLARLLHRFPGTLGVTLHLKTPNNTETIISLPDDDRITPTPELREALAGIFAGESTAYVEA